MRVEAYMNSLMLIGELIGKPEDLSKAKDNSVVKFKIKVITKPYDKEKPNVEQEVPIIAAKFQALRLVNLKPGTPLLVKAKISVKESVSQTNGKTYETINIVAVDIASLDVDVHNSTKNQEFDDDIPF